MKSLFTFCGFGSWTWVKSGNAPVTHTHLHAQAARKGQKVFSSLKDGCDFRAGGDRRVFFLQETSPFQLFLATVLVFFSIPDNWHECTHALLNRASKRGVWRLQGNLLEDEWVKHWIVSGWSPVVLSRLPRLSHNKAGMRYSLRNSWGVSAKTSANHRSAVSFLKWKWEVCRDEMWNLCCSSCDVSTLPSILPFKGATKRLKARLGTKLLQRRNQLKPLLAQY